MGLPLLTMLWDLTVSACSFGRALAKVFKGLEVSTGTIYVAVASVGTAQSGSRFLIFSLVE